MGTEFSLREAHGALTAVLLGDPLGGEGAHGAASFCVSCQRSTDLSLAMVVAAVQVAGLVEGTGVQQAVAGLEEAFELCELLTGVFALQSQDGCVVAGLSQSHVLGLIAAGGERPTSSCQSYQALSSEDAKALLELLCLLLLLD